MDASPYEWISGIKCSLHGAIDDARGDTTGLYFSPNECLNGYFKVKRQTLLVYGLPISIYVDRHTIFKAPGNTKTTISARGHFAKGYPFPLADDGMSEPNLN